MKILPQIQAQKFIDERVRAPASIWLSLSIFRHWMRWVYLFRACDSTLNTSSLSLSLGAVLHQHRQTLWNDMKNLSIFITHNIFILSLGMNWVKKRIKKFIRTFYFSQNVLKIQVMGKKNHHKKQSETCFLHHTKTYVNFYFFGFMKNSTTMMMMRSYQKRPGDLKMKKWKT